MIEYIANFGIGSVLTIVDSVGYLIGYIAGLFVNIGGSLVNWTLTLNSQVLTSSTVKIGWVVSRDLANLGFVLAIILIAFITILRIETYQTQKLLWRLIVVALLVNFSLVGAGLFLDFSGMLTNFFINKATSYNPSQIGAGLADAFQVQKLLWPTDSEDAIKKLVQGVASDYNAHIPFTASIVFVAVFTAVVAMSLISLAAMLYIRYIWLTILLILMPLAWLCWVWPDLENNWKTWWNKFMQWTLFAPAVTFFVYLALSIVSPEHKTSIMPVGFEAPPGVTLKEFGAILGRMISVVGILYGGLYTANAMGIAGAGVGFAVAKGTKNMLIGSAVLGGRLGGTATGRLYEKIRGGKSLSDDLRTITAKATKIPLVGGLAANANRALAQAAEGGGGRIEQYKKRFSEMDSEARMQYFKRDPFLMREEERGALMSVLADKNELGKAKSAMGYKDGKWTEAGGEERFERFAKSGIDRGGAIASALIKKDPTLARFKVKDGNTAEIKLKIGEAIKLMSPEAAKEIDLGVFENNPEYLAELSGSHLKEIFERRGEDAERFLTILEESLLKLDQLPKDLAHKISSLSRRVQANPAWAAIRTPLQGVAPATTAKQAPKIIKPPGWEHLIT